MTASSTRIDETTVERAGRGSMSRPAVVGLLAASAVAMGAVALLSHSHGLWQHRVIVAAADDLTWNVTARVESVDVVASTVRLSADLLGIMGAEVLVTPDTWVGIDGRLASLADLPEGSTVKVSFGRSGGRKVARWIAAISVSGRTEPRPSWLEALTVTDRRLR